MRRAPAGPVPADGRRRVVAGAALVLLLAGGALPLWRMTLYAPQYPQGLRLVIDGRGLRGDVDEINALNHYIGMRQLPGGERPVLYRGEEDDEAQAEAIPELALFFPSVALLALGMALTAVVPWRWLRRLVVAGAWTLPVVFLADLQYRLYVYGHTLDPEAAIRLPRFTPRVLGPTSVMNFNVTALPGPGLVLLVLSALVLTVGPAMRTGRPTRLAARLLATAATLLVVAVAVAAPWAPAHATTPGVAPTATAAPAFDLAAAVAAAPTGAVIEVPPGTYSGPLVLTRPVTLRGRGWPVIDGGRRGHVVVITGPEVRLEGFVVRGSALAYSSEAAGIVVQGARAVVRGNRIEDVLFGLYLAGASDAVVEQNTIATADLPLERRGHAVYLWRVRGARLRDNRITRGKDGFYFSFSADTQVEGNTVTGCRYGIHYMYANGNAFVDNVFVDNAVGAAVMNSTDVRLVGNTFQGSRSAATGVGLILKDADRVLVRGNRIVGNATGIEVENAPAASDGWVRLEQNLIAFNGVGFSLMSTAAITATGNAIVENLRPVQPRGALRAEANRWSEGGRGNYWSDYAGFDADGDGVGDVPYSRADVLEDLVARAPALQALLFTPAHHALETAARLAPLVRGAPLLVDPAPLVRPPVPGALPVPEHGARDRTGILWVGLGLLLPGVAAAAARSQRRA
ncbi:MAG: nitrous oxide reductase family maturation protein NosD [Armatimonadota bacterium]|nr:nitrous oxide reductase family maturation protein NosD [Armatimonadota bacterium]MDR7486298.1 nitrous oxide reductase family maturation protein NosD [Armatimonadota bacterium]MDR7532273.1 nitrous oxide reductase family maturation protein NosD [Armatimonadota bacterium]MDR7537254.1 nitrous oxide reductase family maturation protein NosD [Armatimonadota bacterium]